MAGSNNYSMRRVLVVGVGSIGERHVRCFLKTGRAAISICEPKQRLLEEVGNRYEIEHRFADLDAALTRPHDAAVIAVPADSHISMAQRAVDAGLDVLMEKPLSVAMDGVEELLEAVSQKQRMAAVGYVYRAHPSLAAMKQAITSGSLGCASATRSRRRPEFSNVSSRLS